ncbi:hypothetical protein [Legionella cherrii]|uniref:Uncharacterized protein n=1 Tax=Legionella cherrii TaxID=28084 RepID=A0A0W0SDD8_9GAMM|nr:hypothetical protein [Legionella cherrii]KTC80901.1 hypothetical protein Lche_2921 [Legionella cherrii]VEB34080.1 Uncharacterised protein [Legionella cherrii]
MAQIAEGVAKQIADDSLDIVNDAAQMLQNKNDNQSNDDSSMSMDSPSGTNSDLMEIASTMLPDNLNDIVQSVSGGQNQSLADKGENLLEEGADEGMNMGMSFIEGNK